MGRKKIYKFSFSFQLLLFIGSIYHRLYYRRYRVVGKENIPVDGPVIFVSNHQNGLMDPLAIIFAAYRQIVYFARADIFRNKRIARILYYLKVLPVYRPRDGFREVERNRGMFSEAIEVLRQGRAIGILPEGDHQGKKYLRPLRKGAARMALLTEESSGFSLELKIVPAGIDYSNYFRAGSDLLVVFGEPIHVSNYKEAFLENPPKAVSLLTEHLSEELKKVTLNVDPGEDYDAIHHASELSCKDILKRNNIKPGLYKEFQARKKIIENLNVTFRQNNEVAKELSDLTAAYSERLHKYGLRDRIVKKEEAMTMKLILQCVFMIALLPIHLYGMALNYLPYKLPSRFSTMVKEAHLKVSVRFGAGFVLFVLWYLILAIVTLLFPADWYLKVIFLLTLPMTGIISFYYYRFLLKLRGKWRWMKLRRRNPEESERIYSLKLRIKDVVSTLMKQTIS